MNFGLTDEQELIVSTVRSFVEREIYPHEALVEKTGEVPAEIAQDIKQKCLDLGFYASNFPQSVGGPGLSHLEFALVERELGRGSIALTQSPSCRKFWASATTSQSGEIHRLLPV